MSAATSYDIMIAVAPAWVINHRLDRETKAGGLLSGMKHDRFLRMRVDAPRSLPFVRVVGYSDFEGTFGAARPGTGSVNSGTTQTGAIRIELSCEAKHGWMRQNPKAPGQKKGCLEWLALVKDSIETNDAGEVDAALDNTLLKPIKINTVATEISDSVITLILETETFSRGFCKADRHRTLGAMLEAAGFPPSGGS